MNVTLSEMVTRQADARKLHELLDDFRKSEPAIIETAKEVFGSFVRDALPRLQCDALESGEFVGKVTVELFVDLTPGAKTIKLVGLSVPRPWRQENQADIKYGS